MDPILLTGLGNPGDEYADSRHNIGFRVIDCLAERLGCGGGRRFNEYLMATAKVEGISVLLCKPLTYMNNSGRAVAEVLSRYGIDPERMLVVVDDIVLPLGKQRLRGKGSDGGHNGLYSVISEIGSNVFPRLRCGIGGEQKPPKEKTPEFVLSPFEQEERPEANAMVSRAADAALEFVRLGLANAMTRVNR